MWEVARNKNDNDYYNNYYGGMKVTMSPASHQRINIEPGGLGNKRTSGDHTIYSIVEISQNTEKSPED